MIAMEFGESSGQVAPASWGHLFGRGNRWLQHSVKLENHEPSGSFSFTDVNAADRKSTRLNSSHGYISYAVFCLKKKKKANKSNKPPTNSDVTWSDHKTSCSLTSLPTATRSIASFTPCRRPSCTSTPTTSLSCET